jgi:hypothetical protein
VADIIQLRKQKERHAETRRTHKEYMQFIKASQLFYRQLVLELDRIHGGIPGIRKAAQNWRDVNGRESRFRDGRSSIGVAHRVQAPLPFLLRLTSTSNIFCWQCSEPC